MKLQVPRNVQWLISFNLNTLSNDQQQILCNVLRFGIVQVHPEVRGFLNINNKCWSLIPYSFYIYIYIYICISIPGKCCSEVSPCRGTGGRSNQGTKRETNKQWAFEYCLHCTHPSFPDTFTNTITFNHHSYRECSRSWQSWSMMVVSLHNWGRS